jgi:hypothetical protein
MRLPLPARVHAQVAPVESLHAIEHPFRGIAGVGVVGVGTAHEAHLVGVHAERGLLADALDHGVARVVESRNAAVSPQRALAGAVLAVFRVRSPVLLVVAELVRATQDLPEAVAAFGVALDLGHLEQGLEGRTQAGEGHALLVGVALDLGREHMAIAEVRVVGDGEHVASRSRLDALFAQAAPHHPDVGLVHGRDGYGQRRVAAEDHVAVDLRELRGVGVLVGGEGRELAGAAAVGRLGGGGDGLDPGVHGGGGATTSIFATHLGRRHRRTTANHRLDQAGDVSRDEAATPEEPAARALVDGRARAGAERRRPEALRVVRHRGEVEWAVDADGEGGAAGLVERGHEDLLPPGEAVRVVEPGSGIEGVGVHGECRVNVEVAEEDAPVRRVVFTAKGVHRCGSAFDVRRGLPRGAGGEGEQESQGKLAHLPHSGRGERKISS